MDEGAKGKDGPTLTRWNWAMKSKSFDAIRDLKLIETRPEHFLTVLVKGTVSTNVFLRRLHNLALDLDWLSRPVLPKKPWPKVKYGVKRAVMAEEHEKILAGEHNPEWRAFYKLMWHLGGSQTDIARLCAENVNWKEKVVSYRRCKSDEPDRIRFGDDVANVLRELPRSGLLLPAIAAMKESDRGIALSNLPGATPMMSLFAKNPVSDISALNFSSLEPSGNIANFDDRWDWITRTYTSVSDTGMWPLWLSFTQLTRLSLAQIPLTTRAADYSLSSDYSFLSLPIQ